MASLHLTRREARSPGWLPAVCMVCGKPSVREVWFTYRRGFDGSGAIDRRGAGGGLLAGVYLLLYPLFWLGSWVPWLTSWVTTPWFRGLSPRCADHVSAPGLLELRELTSDRVVFEGVHDAFVQAVKAVPAGAEPGAAAARRVGRATAHLPRQDATTPGRLPPVCMVCGRPATGEVWFTYSSRFVYADPANTAHPDPTDAAGCLSVLGYYFVAPFLWLFTLVTTSRFRGLSPRCDGHANAPGGLRLREVTPDKVVVENVHDTFAQAVKGR